MTTSSRNANYNSHTFTDMDYIKRYNLDPRLEGKPEINDAIKRAIKEDTTPFRQRVQNDPE